MHLTRRSVLLGATASGLAACTHDRASTPPPVNPDLALLAAAVARESALLSAYRAAPATLTMSALMADVTTHLARLAALPLDQPRPTATPPVARVAPQALARATAAAHAADVPSATRVLAPVLASLAASAAAHAAVL